MSVDDRLRAALLEAASDRTLDEEHALQAVRARVPRVSSELVDVEERRRPSARGPRLVAVTAACMLIAGAVALSVLVRPSRDDAARAVAASGRCGHAVRSGSRTTAVVRLEAPPSNAPFEFDEPMPAALALCETVLRRARTPIGGINLAAALDGHMLSLTATAPNETDSDGLARAWAQAFVDARGTDVRNQIVNQQRRLVGLVRKAREELLSVDTKLAKEMPGLYGDVVNIDGGRYHFPGRSHPTVPPVPERGSVYQLNLAYERIALLDQITEAATQSSQLRIARVSSDAYASVVSVSSPARLPSPNDDMTSRTLLVVVGGLAAGALLVAGSIVLGRRRRGAQSP